MGSNNIYYVVVTKLVEETITVSALTSDEAKEEALREPGVASVVRVYYPEYSEEEDDG